MGYADIVIPVGSAARETGRIAVAAELARRLDARLHGLYVAAPAGRSRRDVVARKSFFEAASHQGADADWTQLSGDGQSDFLERARAADLIIAPLDPSGADAAATDLGHCRLATASGRPVLVLPPNASKTIGRCVLVAWREGPEAWRALAAAMPILKAADALWVVQAAPNAADLGACDSALEQHLSAQGLMPVMIRRCTASAARAALEAAAACGADLLVMDLGAWREISGAPRRGLGRVRKGAGPAALIAA
ncbi:hypothetical protein [Phenylobacterium montanum]|uniref:Universal stress protein n=1 Tax=Phenylobacterium montanum TaxID=2823693 RepID=A0A975G0T8_9CAUL|nr:hypothetical protein [Caulobacter sp. S6]QUD88686.1 hypothetical protein KCG34_02010 [Caulobacter sp. S6]